MKKILALIRLLFSVSIFSFIRLNFFCRRVHREKGKYIIPYRGTHVKIAKTARINVAGMVRLNINRQPHSRAECLVLLRDGAVWDVKGGFFLYYGTTLQVHKDAHLTTGDKVGGNTGTTIICAYKMTFGNHVAMARGVFVFDSDHHPVYNSEGKRINAAREVVIEDHVWLGLKVTVMKGTRISTGAVISANSVVSGFVPPHSINVTMPARPVLKNMSWER